MSITAADSGARGRRRGGLLVALAGLLWVLAPKPVGAESDEPDVIEAWAEWVTSQGIWKGPTVPFPQPRPRPANLPGRLDSVFLPLHVHFSPPDAETAEQVLTALEDAYSWLDREGWPLPFPDGGRGGTPGFDLYLVPQPGLTHGAHTDAGVAWTYLDAASTHAWLDPHMGPGAVAACTLTALTDAALLGHAPAEASRWRAATGAYLSWLATDRFGCAQPVVEQQLAPGRGWLSPDDQGAGAALLLAMLSEREDGGQGTFLRELWQFARQRSQPLSMLRASPDMWEVLQTALANAGEDLESIMLDFAVARFHAGARPGAQAFASLRQLPNDATVPLASEVHSAELPEHLPPADPPLGAYGSQYHLVHLEPGATGQLKVWLRGELGAKWALTAVRMDGQGKELGRMTAPARRAAKSFLPVELFGDTATVLLVVTKVPLKLPDADGADQPLHTYTLILNR